MRFGCDAGILFGETFFFFFSPICNRLIDVIAPSRYVVGAISCRRFRFEIVTVLNEKNVTVN